MKRSRFAGFPLLAVLATFALTAALYASLPDSYAIHWDLQGRPNGFQSKPMAFGMPALMLILLFVLGSVPDQARELHPDRTSPMRIVIGSTMLLLGGCQVFILLSALRAISVSPVTYVMAAVGLFFVVLGNYMGKIRRNHFIGIRTPWTLRDEEVWLRTHRMGGKLFMVAGIATMLSVVAEGELKRVALPSILLAALIPCAYSFWVYRRLHPNPQGQ